jgi:hypothetical protein
MMLMRVVMPVGELLATALVSAGDFPPWDSLAGRSVALAGRSVIARFRVLAAVTGFDIAVSHRGTAALTRAATTTAPTTTASTSTTTRLASLAALALTFATPFLAFSATRNHRG